MIDPSGIYRATSCIPSGRLCSYGDVAAMAGLPGKARLVGRVLSQLPRDSNLPWYRVINAQGKISFPVGSESYLRQLQKLQDEGSADADGAMRWRQCRWQGATAS